MLCRELGRNNEEGRGLCGGSVPAAGEGSAKPLGGAELARARVRLRWLVAELRVDLELLPRWRLLARRRARRRLMAAQVAWAELEGQACRALLPPALDGGEVETEKGPGELEGAPWS